MIYLDVLTEKQCQLYRVWRNQYNNVYRTSYKLTKEMQQDFYKNVICNRDSNNRYFSVNDSITKDFCGVIGLTNIEWENGLAEIAISIDPGMTKKGIGHNSVKLILKKAFSELRLNSVYGECYMCNKSIGFWENMIGKFNGYKTRLPCRKYHEGKYHDSLYFVFFGGN